MKKMFSAEIRAMATALLFGLAFLAGPSPGLAAASEPTDQKVLVDQALIAFGEFQAAPEMKWFRDTLKDAKGVLIVPNLYKGGLVFGGSGGKGVYLAKDTKTGAWNGPAFYNMGSFTFGLQIGAEVSQVVILAMTDEAVNAMLSPQFKMGGDATVAAGPIGTGVAGSVTLPPAAFIAYSRAKGAFAGLTVEGAVVKIDGEANAAYYGKYVSPEDILVAGRLSTIHSEGLREALKKAACC